MYEIFRTVFVCRKCYINAYYQHKVKNKTSLYPPCPPSIIPVLLFIYNKTPAKRHLHVLSPVALPSFSLEAALIRLSQPHHDLVALSSQPRVTFTLLKPTLTFESPPYKPTAVISLLFKHALHLVGTPPTPAPLSFLPLCP